MLKTKWKPSLHFAAVDSAATPKMAKVKVNWRLCRNWLRLFADVIGWVGHLGAGPSRDKAEPGDSYPLHFRLHNIHFAANRRRTRVFYSHPNETTDRSENRTCSQTCKSKHNYMYERTRPTVSSTQINNSFFFFLIKRSFYENEITCKFP